MTEQEWATIINQTSADQLKGITLTETNLWKTIEMNGETLMVIGDAYCHEWSYYTGMAANDKGEVIAIRWDIKNGDVDNFYHQPAYQIEEPKLETAAMDEVLEWVEYKQESDLAEATRIPMIPTKTDREKTEADKEEAAEAYKARMWNEYKKLGGSMEDISADELAICNKLLKCGLLPKETAEIIATEVALLDVVI